MADISITSPSQEVVLADTNDNVLVLGSWGQRVNQIVSINVTVGTVNFKLNGAASGGTAVDAGEQLPPFKLRDGVDVLHVQAGSTSDAFWIGLVDA